MGKLNKEAEDQKKLFKHDSHHHPVVLTKIHNTIQTLCSGCRINILPREDYFACMPCHFFLHKRCFELPSSTTHDSHPHLLTLKFKTPYEGEEGFKCDLCAQPGTNQWLYCRQQCHYDVHLRCAKPQTGPNFQASSRSDSLANVKPALVNATTFDIQSANPPRGVRENFHNFHPGKTSMANQPVLVSQNAMTMTANRVPLNTTTPPIITSQYGQKAAYLGQSGNYSHGFQASRYPFSPTTASRTIQPILMSPNGTTVFATRCPINNGTNPAMVVPQSRPSLAYSNNGVVYLNAAQGINNQIIYLRPNGGGAPMAAVVPQNQGLGYGNPVFYGAHNGMTGWMKETAITGFTSGFGGAFGEEMFPGVTGMWGGDDDGEGSMGLDGSEFLNSYFGEYSSSEMLIFTDGSKFLFGLHHKNVFSCRL